LLKDGFVVNTILKEADLFCPNSVRINFTIYHTSISPIATYTIAIKIATCRRFIIFLFLQRI
ncbi:hypothetical protein EFT47_02620, partial [Lentilactobacillus buchneri]|nr:hypothetical protein [Lentilactobacillus buchneri]